MRAIAITEYGGTDVLRDTEVDDPPLGPDRLVVEVRAAGVNPVDWKVREGGLHGVFPSHFPLVPGWDLAGVVLGVGPAVQEFAEGDEVVAYLRHDHIQYGTYAEKAMGEPRHFAHKPASVGFEEAAALPLAGLTAMQSLRLARVGDGDTVLVHAAAGGVGTFAVQLARHAGATVIGTASARNHGALRELGATPVAYGDGLEERVRAAAPDGVTASVDYVGTAEAFAVSAAVVGDPSRIVSNVDPVAVAEVGGRYSFVRPNAGDLAELCRLVDDGVVRIHVEEVFDLADAGAAHDRSRTGHVRGKLVLRVS